MTTDRQQTEGQDGGAYGSAAATEGWRRGAAARAQFLGPITEMMLDLADIGPGSRVLDVGAGTGEQTLMAAHRVGPTGSGLAIFLAASMLAVAAEAAQQAGLSSVETRVADARDLDLEPESFDAAISRLVLMLISGRERALAGVYRALKPGGKLAAIVFSSAEKNSLNALPRAIVRRHAGLPPLDDEDPGIFALGDPEAFRATYERAGFRGVDIRVVPTVRRFPSVAAAVQFRLDAGHEFAQLLADLSDGRAPQPWPRSRRSCAGSRGPTGWASPPSISSAWGPNKQRRCHIGPDALSRSRLGHCPWIACPL